MVKEIMVPENDSLLHKMAILIALFGVKNFCSKIFCLALAVIFFDCVKRGEKINS